MANDIKYEQTLKIYEEVFGKLPIFTSAQPLTAEQATKLMIRAIKNGKEIKPKQIKPGLFS